MTGYAGFQRKLFRLITREVSQVEAMMAMRQYVVRNIPTKYQKGNRSDSEVVAAFLAERRDEVLGRCANCIEENQCALLTVERVQDFDLDALDVSSLVIIARFFLPFPPKERPEPTNSIWTTRLKLLSSTGNLVNFVRLWRLWSKYKHNQMMNHSIPEIEADFRSLERAVLVVAIEKTNLGRKLARYRHLLEMIGRETDDKALKLLIECFDAVAADLHSNDSHLEHVFHNANTVDYLLETLEELPKNSSRVKMT